MISTLLQVLMSLLLDLNDGEVGKEGKENQTSLTSYILTYTNTVHGGRQ